MPIRRYNPGKHPYHSYQARSSVSPPKKWRGISVLLSLVVVSFFGIIFWRVNTTTLPKPQIKINYSSPETSKSILISWPSAPSAIGTIDNGVVANKESSQASHPTASTAKLITVLTVLKKKPLGVNEQGPTVVMNREDTNNYNRYYSEGGSTITIQDGQQISQRQLIEGILVVSSNNYADSLAIWAFGSLENYRKAAQEYVKSIGAKHTVVGGDASGFLPTTVSTAHDLVLIGIEAAKQPLMKEIMAKKSVDLPILGVKDSTNWLLGTNGFIGGKTGNTDQAGGVFVGIADKKISRGKNITIVTAVQGSETVNQAMSETEDLLTFVSPLFKEETLIKRGEKIGTIKTEWGETSDVVAEKPLRSIIWNGEKYKLNFKMNIKSAIPTKGSQVGFIKYKNDRIALVTAQNISVPSWQWKVTHLWR